MNIVILLSLVLWPLCSNTNLIFYQQTEIRYHWVRCNSIIFIYIIALLTSSLCLLPYALSQYGLQCTSLIDVECNVDAWDKLQYSFELKYTKQPWSCYPDADRKNIKCYFYFIYVVFTFLCLTHGWLCADDYVTADHASSPVLILLLNWLDTCSWRFRWPFLLLISLPACPVVSPFIFSLFPS